MSIGALIEKFRDVALDRLENMNLALVSLERRGDDEETTADLLREIHTLKGEAKMLGFADVNLVAHQIESIMMSAAELSFDVPKPAINLIFEGLDTLRLLLTKQIGTADNAIDLAEFTNRVQLAIQGFEQLSYAEPDDGFPEIEADPFEPLSEAQEMRPHASPVRNVQAQNTTQLRLQTENSIRVRFDKLERLGEATSEVLMMNRRLAYQHTRLNRTNDAIKQWLAAAEPTLPKSQHASMRAILHQLESIASSARDENHLAQLRINQLNDEVRGLRHISLAQVTSHYPRAVRDLAQMQGKQVRFIQEVGNIEVDRTILSALSDPLLHLIRNAVDHGVETPEERLASNKQEEAEIVLKVHQQSDHLRIVLSDDGRGIDPHMVRRKAVAHGLLTEMQAEQMDERDAISLIFQPGFSTRDEISDVSGRGLGMDIVLRQITTMSGVVDLDSQVNQGTIFTLYLPLPSAIGVVLCVRIGTQTYALQSQDVERVVYRRPSQLIHLHGAPCIREDGQIIPVQNWRELLGAAPNPSDRLVFLIVNKGNKRIAISVDDVIGDREAMTRPLGDFLQGLSMCRGVALTNTDEVIPVLNVLELLTQTQQHSPSPRRKWSTMELRALRPNDQQKTILLAEDSEVTRAMIAAILNNLGYRTLEAENGQMAWQMLQHHHVDLLITDIQMPLMGGLQLLELLNASPSLKTIPSIVLSTLGSAQDKAQAMQRGADMYLVKLDFREKELISAVQRYLKKP